MTKKQALKQPIDQAIETAKKSCKTKFDSTIELHINLDIDPKKTEQAIRTTTVLPHGTGKTVKVAVFSAEKIPGADVELSESTLSKIEKGEIKPKTDFDVIITEPEFMPKLAKIAKILGPMGLMPNPKAGTVTNNVKKALEQTKKGKVEIRNETAAPVIHTVLGKRSFDTKALVENFNEIMKSVKQAKPQKVKPEFIRSCYISTTMGPSIEIELN